MAQVGQVGTGSGFGASALSAYISKLESTISGDAQRRIVRSAGMAAKDAALDAAETKLGSDRAMSNWKSGRVPLRAGFDEAGWVLSVNHRPGGLWKVADQGRQRSGPIYPRRNGRKAKMATQGKAVLTPYGPRALSSYGPSRGTGVFRLAAARERASAPQAAWKQLSAELRRITRG